MNSYTCDACGGTFEKVTPDDKANAEAERNFGVANASARDDMAIVCDKCFRKIMRWSVAGAEDDPTTH